MKTTPSIHIIKASSPFQKTAQLLSLALALTGSFHALPSLGAAMWLGVNQTSRSYAHTKAVAVSGDYLYLTTSQALGSSTVFRLLTYDVSKPTAPSFLASSSLPSSVDNMVVTNGLAYLVSLAGLTVLDLFEPARPFILTKYKLGATSFDVVTPFENQVLVGGSFGLEVLDLSDPARPLIAGRTPCGRMNVLTRDGDHAYACTSAGGLYVFDLATPTEPALVGQVSGYGTKDKGTGIAVAKGKAYLTDVNYGLRIVDVSQPKFPRVIGGYRTSGQAQGVTLVGDGRYALILEKLAAYDSQKLKVLDISNPANVVVIDTILLDRAASFCAAQGDYVYVARETAIFDIYKLNLHSAQTITFHELPQMSLASPSLTLTATASSGLPVQFSVLSGPAVLAGNTLSVTGTGTVTVRADQAGNTQYAPADPMVRSFQVNAVPLGARLQMLKPNTLAISGQIGVTYQVESTSDLAHPTWTVLGSITLINTTQTWTDRRSPLPKTSFYRVWQQ